MRRESKVHLKDIYSHYSLFSWEECCFCGEEFVREKGFRKETGPFFGELGVWRYLCSECAPDKQIAYDLFETQPWVVSLPTTPPCSPPRPPTSR